MKTIRILAVGAMMTMLAACGTVVVPALARQVVPRSAAGRVLRSVAPVAP